MSIEKLTRKTGVTWQVRYRDANGSQRARCFDRKRDAVTFETTVRQRKQAGDLATIEGGRMTLAEFVRDEWWPLYAVQLADATRGVYAALWDAHVLEQLGGYRLRDLRPDVIERFRASLTAAGVGPSATRKTLLLLQGVLQRAVEWGRLPSNPARYVRKPPQPRQRTPRPLAPSTVETMRQRLLQRGDLRDATLISVLAYAGLRPEEALALSWRHVRERTLLIELALSDGQFKSTKNNRSRTVRLLGPLAGDLAEWRLASGRPAEETLVFPTPSGRPWRRHDYQNWRRRTFDQLAADVGLRGAVPYDLRHSFCSLLIGEGATVVEVARQAGHTAAVSLSTYQHVIEELEGDRRPAEDQIRRARQELAEAISPRSTVASGGS